MASGDSHYDHVVFVSVDTMRSDAIGANPIPLWPAKHPSARPVKTTVLDELAGGGSFFPNMISAAPYTAASHATILTGQYPLRNGLHEFYNGSLRAPTVFTYGRRAGRRTVMKVDFPIILGPELGFTRDVDVYLSEEDDQFIDAVVSARSTVALAHFGGVHVPYGFHNTRFGGDVYREKTAELDAMVPASVPFADLLVESYRDAEDTELLVRYKRATQYLHSEQRYDELFQLYLDGVEHFLTTRLEPFLARLTERVAATGRSLLLVLFADHGEEFDEYSNGHFNSMAEGVLRVPLIISGDGIGPAVHLDRIRTADITPTVMELAGIATSATGLFDGQSLAPVVRGETVLPGDAAALAEAYTSDLNEFVAFQREQLSGQAPGPLAHVLVGHAAYLGDQRVVRLTQQYLDMFRQMKPTNTVWVEQFGDGRLPARVPHADPAPLLAMLDDYRTALTPPVDVPVTAGMRDQLRALGYRV